MICFEPVRKEFGVFHDLREILLHGVDMCAEGSSVIAKGEQLWRLPGFLVRARVESWDSHGLRHTVRYISSILLQTSKNSIWRQPRTWRLNWRWYTLPGTDPTMVQSLGMYVETEQFWIFVICVQPF